MSLFCTNMASCVPSSRIPLSEGWVLSYWAWQLVTNDSLIVVASSTLFIIMVSIAKASSSILVCGLSPLYNMLSCATSLTLWLGHFFNKALYLSHASQKCSSNPWEEVVIAALVLFYLDVRKNLAINFLSTSSQLVKLWFQWDCNHILALLENEKRNKLR